jgi:putative intracellular protease/amidase
VKEVFMKEPQGKNVAILVENGFEQVELFEPRQALEEAGARTVVVSPVDLPLAGARAGGLRLPLVGSRPA